LRRNCPLLRVIEDKIKGGLEVIGRRGKRRRKLLDDLKERRGYSHLKDLSDVTSAVRKTSEVVFVHVIKVYLGVEI